MESQDGGSESHCHRLALKLVGSTGHWVEKVLEIADSSRAVASLYFFLKHCVPVAAKTTALLSFPFLRSGVSTQACTMVTRGRSTSQATVFCRSRRAGNYKTRSVITQIDSVYRTANVDFNALAMYVAIESVLFFVRLRMHDGHHDGVPRSPSMSTRCWMW